MEKYIGYPVKGAKEYLLSLKDRGYEIVINTARIVNIVTFEIDENALIELKEWLIKNEIPFDFIFPKIPAYVYIDDRAIEFDQKNKNKRWNHVSSMIKKLK